MSERNEAECTIHTYTFHTFQEFSLV